MFSIFFKLTTLSPQPLMYMRWSVVEFFLMYTRKTEVENHLDDGKGHQRWCCALVWKWESYMGVKKAAIWSICRKSSWPTFYYTILKGEMVVKTQSEWKMRRDIFSFMDEGKLKINANWCWIENHGGWYKNSISTRMSKQVPGSHYQNIGSPTWSISGESQLISSW